MVILVYHLQPVTTVQWFVWLTTSSLNQIIFMGSSPFGLPTLKSISSRCVAVYTRAPRPKGRGQKLHNTCIHEYAQTHNIPVYTPKTLRDVEHRYVMTKYKPDFIVVAAYGLILPQEILDIPKKAPLNIHGSILPRWRGAAPIQRAIMAGDKKTGVCIMHMTAGLDEGDMYLSQEIPIKQEDTFQTIHDQLATIGAELLLQTIDQFKTLKAIPQTQEGMTYAPKIEKQEQFLDLTENAHTIYNRIRGVPGGGKIYFTLPNGSQEVLTIFQTENTYRESKIPGYVGVDEQGHFILSCSDYDLYVTRIQRQGKKVLDISEFMHGLMCVQRHN